MLLLTTFRHLKPGAWFELSELGSVVFSDDNSIPEGWAPKRAIELLVQGLELMGRIVPDAKWLKKLLVDAGFVDVEVSQALERCPQTGVIDCNLS